MSKSLKKLIDINRLREFKNKLVRMGSAYVQTGAVDQTVAGTKTFSKPIVGSVTGSSGSCTGNAASANIATKATQDSDGNKITTTYSKNGHTHDDRYYTENEVNNLLNGKANTSGTYSNLTVGNAGSATNATYANWLRTSSHSDHLFHTEWDNAGYFWTYVTAGNGDYRAVRVARSNSAATAQACTGNAATATKLATARTINGTSFNGSANITTANWGTARNISITDGTNTSTAVSVNGSANVSLNLPATIKANLTGNCSGSSGSCTGNAASADTATKATQDAAGNTITTTYATKAENNTKANNSEVVHKSGDETIAGTKTFSNGVLSTAVNAFMAQNNGYTLVLRNDGSYTYLLMSDKGGVPGTWSDARPLTISNSTGVCDISGNASTATKLAAKRTIALSGAATGTATGFDGSGNITIPVTALSPSAIRAQWYAAYPDGAEAHNAMWGGRDITAAFNNGTVSANIANGTFKDIFPGDYITKQVTISGTAYTVNWVVADCDYWWHKGNQNNGMERHHVVIVPQTPIFNARMNATNTAEGGYAGSEMHRNVIPACATGIINAFGASHILTFRDLLTRDLNTSAVSSGITSLKGATNWNGDWYSQECHLMSEAMVYDGPHYASSAYDNIMATRQMSAFRLSERLINYNRQHWWLRDVVSSARFAFVNGGGLADMNDASFVYGVRPFALLI